LLQAVILGTLACPEDSRINGLRIYNLDSGQARMKVRIWSWFSSGWRNTIQSSFWGSAGWGGDSRIG